MSETVEETKTYWLRLQKIDPKMGFRRQSQTLPGGARYRQGKWYIEQWTKAQYDYASKKRQSSLNANSPLLFEIYDSQEKYEDVVRAEKKAIMKAKGENSPDYDPELFEVEKPLDTPVFNTKTKLADTSRVGLRKIDRSPEIVEVPTFKPEASVPLTQSQKAAKATQEAVEARKRKKDLERKPQTRHTPIGKKS